MAFASSGSALTPRGYPAAARNARVCQSALSSSVISETEALASPNSIAVLSL